MKKIAIFIFLSVVSTVYTQAQSGAADLQKWPKDYSPATIGKRVADRFVATPHPNFGRPTPPKTITYPEVCAWYGALTFAQASKDSKLTQALAARFEPLFGAEANLVPTPD